MKAAEAVRDAAREQATRPRIIEKPQDAIRRRLRERRDEIARLLPSHMTIERLEHLMLSALKEDPNLLNCAAWDEGLDSFVVAACQAAIVGLEPGRLHDLAYITAQRTGQGYVAKFETTYKGDISVLYRSNAIKSIRAEVVYEKDRFDIDLAGNKPPVHKPFLGGERGDAIGAYSIVHLSNGDTIVEWMPRSELDKAMRHTKMVNKQGEVYGPWDEWWGEMAKKSVLRRQSKRLPLTPQVQALMAQDQSSEYAPPPDPAGALQAMEEPLDLDGVKDPIGDPAPTPPARQEGPKFEKPPVARKAAAPAASPENLEPTPKEEKGPARSASTAEAPAAPKVTGGQASLLKHLMEQGGLTGDKAIGFLKQRTGVTKVEDLTVTAFKGLLAEVRKASA